jgi:hypothetical protein
MWLPPFRPAVAVTLVKSKEAWTIEGAEFKHPRTTEPWAVSRHIKKAVSNEEAAKVLASLQDLGFWTQLSWEDPEESTGPMWVIEGRIGNGFHVVSRKRAPIDGRFLQAGALFVALSGFDAEISGSEMPTRASDRRPR